MKRICLFLNLSLMTAAGLHAQFSGPRLSQKTTDSLKQVPLRVIPSSFYADHLGFFCRKELQIEKATKLPVRFRLGSLEYTDHLEGKH